MGVRAVVCDLGGVVIPIDMDRIRDSWAARSPLPPSEARAVFPGALYEALGRGDVAPDAYLTDIRQRLQFEGTDDDLVAAFNTHYLGIDQDVVDLLWQLRELGALVVALSNTNELHHAVWSRRYAQDLEVFEAVHCSHELRARKPEPEAFRRVLVAHDLAPAETVFIDDVPDYVDAASALGLHAIHFEGADQVVRDLDGLPWMQR